MKIIKYFLQYKGKVIGIFNSRDACLDHYMKMIGLGDPLTIMDYKIVDFPIDENDNEIYNLLELE